MLDKILTLINAGFSREEIALILSQESAGPGAPASAPVPAEPDPVSVPSAVASAPVPVPVPDSAVPAPAPDMAGISHAIEEMGRNIIAALQRAQIGGSNAPAPVDPNAEIDRITAQIINPTYKKEE